MNEKVTPYKQPKRPRHYAAKVLLAMREAMRDVPKEYRRAVTQHLYCSLLHALHGKPNE